MKVSAQIAEKQFPDLVLAAECGEEIVIERSGKPSLVLVPKPEPSPTKVQPVPLRELLGIGIGLVQVPNEEQWRAIKRAFAADMPDFSQVKSVAS